MANERDINFDDFQREINAAEDYLRVSFEAKGGQLSSGGGTSNSDVGTSASNNIPRRNPVPLDETRKFDILQQLGRRPLGTSAPSSSQGNPVPETTPRQGRRTYSYNDGDNEDDDDVIAFSTPDSIQGEQEQEQEEKQQNISGNNRGGGESSSSSSRYSQPIERERLIARLVAEHNVKDVNRSRSQDLTGGGYDGGAEGSTGDGNNDEYDDDDYDDYAYANDSLNPDLLKTIRRGGSRKVTDEYENENLNNSNASNSFMEEDSTATSGGKDDTLFFASDLSHWGGEGGNGDGKFLSNMGGDDNLLSYSANYRAGKDGQRRQVVSSSSSSSSSSSTLRPQSASAATLQSKGRATTPIATTTKETRKSAAGVSSLSSSLELNNTTATAGSAVSGMKYLKSREDLIREADFEFKQSHGFKPTLSEKVQRREREALGWKRRPDLSTRIDEMHKSHEKTIKSREKQRQDLENIELVECTFQPKISKGANVILKEKAALAQATEDEKFRDYDQSNNSSSSSSNMLDVALRLHEEAEQRAQQHRWLEHRVTEARMAQYTFTPTINPQSHLREESIEYKPIYERIGELQRDRNKRLQDLRSSREEAYSQTYTFAPQIDSKSRKIAKQRLQGYRYDNNTTSQNRSSSSSRRRGDDDDDDDDDNISSRSTIGGVAEAEAVLQLQSDVGSRLLNEGRKIAKQKQKLLEEREKIESSMMEPVKPSKGTEKLAQKSKMVGATFEERQRMYRDYVDEHANARIKERQEEGASWFKPSIGKSAEIAAKTRLPGETPEQRDNRLSVGDKEEIDQRRKEKEDEIYGKITFAPTIDPVSKAIGRHSGIEELVNNDRGKRIKDVARQKVEAKIGEECTFRPAINEYPYPGAPNMISQEEKYHLEHRPFGWVDCPLNELEVEGMSMLAALGPGGVRSGSSRIDSGQSVISSSNSGPPRACINLKEPEKMSRDIRIYLQEKEEKRRNELVAREIEELRECTFQPAVQNYVPGPEECVIVRGLGRHLELKHLSHSKKVEALVREKEVFSVKNINKYRRQEDGTTIVKPFVFNETNRGQSRAITDLQEKEEKELTFSPETNININDKKFKQRPNLTWV